MLITNTGLIRLRPSKYADSCKIFPRFSLKDSATLFYS